MTTETKTETAGYAVVKKVYEGEIDFSEVSAGDARLPTPAERIRHHLAESHAMGRLSLAHLLFAGWELFRQKSLLGWGKWENWCKAELGFSKDTADRYIGFFLATVGETRRLAGRDMSAEVSDKEMAAATVGMEHKSATRAMVDLGIMKRPPKWGGDRRDKAAENGHTVGRPSKGSPAEVAKELDAAANSEALLWSASKGAIGTLLGLDRDKDFLRRLTDEHLAVAARSLADLSKKAGELLSARLARRDMGLHGEEMETGEVLKVLERGL